jgi:hypothetical protein
LFEQLYDAAKRRDADLLQTYAQVSVLATQSPNRYRLACALHAAHRDFERQLAEIVRDYRISVRES